MLERGRNRKIVMEKVKNVQVLKLKGLKMGRKIHIEVKISKTRGK